MIMESFTFSAKLKSCLIENLLAIEELGVMKTR